ncbi:MAG: class I SAM-dependent methyltransferase [Sedimentibacter sp.]
MDEIKYGKLVDFVHMLLNQSYCGKNNLNFIDATCGNGFDTLFLCKLAGADGNIKAFDIQQQAIERTTALLKGNLEYINYEIILDSHEFIPKYLSSYIDAAVFNLGYLPFSDKTVTTKGDTTVNAIQNLIPCLNNNGRIYITTYITHDTGDEINEIYNLLSGLDKSKYNVLHINLVNKENTPPELFIIEKNA